MATRAPAPAALPLSRAAADTLSTAREDPAWLRQIRLEAWEAFEALPAPATTHPEAWRRTDVSGLGLETLTLPRGARPDRPTFHGPIARDAADRAGLLTH